MTAEEAVIMANGDLYIIDATPSLVQNESSSSSSRHHSSSSSRSGLGEGPAIKGGEPHLLIVYAASPDLKGIYTLLSSHLVIHYKLCEFLM